MSGLDHVPVPRFAIGQKVWGATTRDAAEELGCPDCLGKKMWQVTSPAGTVGEVACPRCGGHGVLLLRSVRGEVRELTVGSVRIDTQEREDHVEYMCEETGIGSGTLHAERLLFLTREGAQVEAEMMSARGRARLEEGDRERERAEIRSLSMWQLRDAAVIAAEGETSRTKSCLNRLMERLAGLEDGAALYSNLEKMGKERKEFGTLRMEPEDVGLLVDHLCWVDNDLVKLLLDWRAENKCKCD